ncbi:MAG TPA: imidazoleglycerol-phosphate dehydratase HisB [Clostridiales bacterium]|nr:imidazoleglycerol-phosphate dehydratase HisB [Clostridiales bacterium]
MKRFGELKRTTNETDVFVSLNLDGEGKSQIDTGIGFFDHMLELFAAHGNFDLTVKCKGDLKVDGHHTVEDVGIVLGKLINQILGDKKGIKRYGEKTVPMDEALVRAVVDVSGRPFLVCDLNCKERIGDFDGELTEEFFRALSSYGLITMHINKLSGKNTHHIIEAAFKAVARALSQALKVVSDKIPSSKGIIE